MDIVKLVKKTKSEKALNLIAKLAIKKATKKSIEDNDPTSFIGTGSDININVDLTNPIYYVYDCYHGYIPKDTKIVYITFFDLVNSTYMNKGYYYFLDDESYIIDFFHYIKDKEINSDYDLIVVLKNFLDDYFNIAFGDVKREKLHHLLYETDDRLYAPIKEHSIMDFKGNGSALCSEYTALAQNILSVLGFDVYYMMSTSHAYNVLVYDTEKESKAAILDFASGVDVYDHDYNEKNPHPFIEDIPDMGEDVRGYFKTSGTKVTLEDYYIVNINGGVFRVYTGVKRSYSLMSVQLVENDFTLTR